jgi:hypothetical protein
MSTHVFFRSHNYLELVDHFPENGDRIVVRNETDRCFKKCF